LPSDQIPITDDVIIVNTLQGAKEKIFLFLKDGMNYRDIVKKQFSINGVIKKYNPSQIAKIKKEFDHSVSSDSSNQSQIFKLFKEGKNPIDVVIALNLDFDFVDKLYKQFLESNNQDLVPKGWLESINEKIAAVYLKEPCDQSIKDFYFDGPDFVETIDYFVEDSLNALSELKKESENPMNSNRVVFRCMGCKQMAFADEDMLKIISEHCSHNAWHTECEDRARYALGIL
jgi:hypothetical protein